MKKQQFTVRVPATTSNFGPGFDCLGAALRIYNYIAVWRSHENDCVPMAAQTGKKFFAATNCAPFSFSCKIEGDVPVARGLGSSVTLRLGVLHALNTFAGQPLTRPEICRLCAQLEGHPDNAAPAEFGGFTVARGESQQKFIIDARLKFVLLLPPFEVATARARKVLPNEIDHGAAVRSSGNACAITAAMASGKYENLRGMFSDHLHQPFRAKFVPFLPAVIDAAEKAGALGGFLSGSGSTIACLTLRSPQRVAAAMLAACALPDAQTVVTTVDNSGVRLHSSVVTRHSSLFSHAPLA